MTLGEAIRALRDAGKVKSRWLPITPVEHEPDLADPATVGCLLALLREAWGRPKVSVAYDAEDQRWTLVAWDSEMGWRDAKPGWPLVGPTEGEAIAAALTALATALATAGGAP